MSPRSIRGTTGDGDQLKAASAPPPDQATDFSELFDCCFADLWAYVRRRVANGADADDVTAEVFAVAWRRRDQLPTPNERRLWLFGVARNLLRNHQRSALRQRRLFGKLTGLAEANNVAADAAEHLDLDGRCDRDGRSDRDGNVWSALSRLSADDCDLLLMRAWDRLSVGDIATILGCTPNAVSLRLSKAKARLRIELGEKDQMSSGHEVLNPAGKGEPNDGTSQ